MADKWPDKVWLSEGGFWYGWLKPSEDAPVYRLDTPARANAEKMLEALKDVYNYFWNPDCPSPILKESDVEEIVCAAIAEASEKFNKLRTDTKTIIAAAEGRGEGE